jgi:Cyclin, N-terminal domain/Cyclin, C-terminal domain
MMEEVLCTIAAMREQERRYSSPAVWSSAVSADVRSRIVSWMYSIIEYVDLSRETVEISMNLVDRYIATPEGGSALHDPNMYQLAALTCMYTAIKIHERAALDLETVSKLSRGTYAPQEIAEMESRILFALHWHLNPPTALCFVRQLLELIPTDVITDDYRRASYDIAKYLSELAVSEGELVPVKSSTIAFGALMNALESTGVDSKLVGRIGQVLSHALGISCLEDDVVDVQSWLFKAVVQQEGSVLCLQSPSSTSSTGSKALNTAVSVSDASESPRSVR